MFSLSLLLISPKTEKMNVNRVLILRHAFSAYLIIISGLILPLLLVSNPHLHFDLSLNAAAVLNV